MTKSYFCLANEAVAHKLNELGLALDVASGLGKCRRSVKSTSIESSSNVKHLSLLNSRGSYENGPDGSHESNG